MKFARTLQAVGFAAAFVLAGAAQADSVEITGHPHGTVLVDIDSPNNINGFAGEFSIKWNGNSFNAWCVDVLHTVSSGGVYNNAYTALSPSAYGLTPVKIGLMDTLFSNYYTTSQSSAVNSGAFQIALWEIVYDGGGALNIYANSFIMGSSGDATAKSTAQSWLTALTSAPVTNNWNFTVLRGDALAGAHYQDLVVAAPVPEPESWALMLAGLGVLVATGRRRLSKTA